MARRTKRLWTDQEKRAICLQTTAPGVSIARVAQRYATNANLIFKSLRDPRYAPEVPAEPDAACIFPVEIVDHPMHDDSGPAAGPVPVAGTIEIDTAARVAVIISSTRDTRFGRIASEWIAGVASERDDVETELVDLRDFDLPFFNDKMSKRVMPSEDPRALAWQK